MTFASPVVISSLGPDRGVSPSSAPSPGARSSPYTLLPPAATTPTGSQQSIGPTPAASSNASIGTTGPSHASLNSAPGGPSLFKQCRLVLRRLETIPSVSLYIRRVKLFTPRDQTQYETEDAGIDDPLTTLWNAFRLGQPLAELYNMFALDEPIAWPNTGDKKPPSLEYLESSTVNTRKAQVFHFITGCRQRLGYGEDDLFTITDLFQDDTNGFVKVVRLVSMLLDRLQEAGKVPHTPHLSTVSVSDLSSDVSDLSLSGAGNTEHPAPPRQAQRMRRKVIDEIVMTERKYVADMEKLQAYMNHVSAHDIISPELIHQLFANLNALVDFQRRFEVGVEAVIEGSEIPGQERLGALFMNLEKEFSVYEAFCANYKVASDLAVSEANNLMKASHVVEPVQELPSLLIKPVQRVCKYPLLLQELLKNSNKDHYQHYGELEEGLKAIKRVADKVNETNRRMENHLLKEDLERRVDDWKNHDPAQFGTLLLSDKFALVVNDTLCTLHMFLFESIILCCQETTKGGFAIRKKRKENGLEIKGRIWVGSIQSVVSEAKGSNFSLKVFWKSVELESFIMRCQNEEQLRQWQTAIEQCVLNLKRQGRAGEHKKHPTQAERSQMRLLSSEDRIKSHVGQGHQQHLIGGEVGVRSPLQQQQQRPGHLSGGPATGAQLNRYTTHTPATLNPLQPSEAKTSAIAPRRTFHHPGQAQLYNPQYQHQQSQLLQGQKQVAQARLPTTLSSSACAPGIKIRVHYRSDVYVIQVPLDISYQMLSSKVLKKIRLCGPQATLTASHPPSSPLQQGSALSQMTDLGCMKIKFEDEDGDRMTMTGDADVQLAFENLSGGEVRLFVTIE